MKTSEKMKSFVIVNTESGAQLISPNTLEYCNQGTRTYPPERANLLRVGEFMRAPGADGKRWSIKRVA